MQGRARSKMEHATGLPVLLLLLLVSCLCKALIVMETKGILFASAGVLN